MATVVKSFAVEGINGFFVEIEATTIRGQQQAISIIGLGDQAVKESGERIQAALEHCGYDIPKDKVVISLAPGDKRKRGSHYDLGMIIGLLQQTDQIAAKNLEDVAFIGEISLNGKLRPCNGILPMVTEAKRVGVKTIVLPEANCSEASKISGIDVIGFEKLKDVVKYLESGVVPERKDDNVEVGEIKSTSDIDFADVRGQNELIEAIVLAAAGGHNILMVGTPGCGKTMIASRIPTILPTMTEQESLEVTKLHSIAGTIEAGHDLIKKRPFRSPHHNVSLNALIGGGTYAQPGEVSLAHNGVLFLDELAEFTRGTLDALRQPLEDKKVTISRVNGTNSYPANFMLVSAMNPCPCGYYPTSKCRCSDYEVLHYRGKISGPILERIDIQKDVKNINYFELGDEDVAPSSAELRLMVEKARAIQNERYKDDDKVSCNAQMTTGQIKQYCILDAESKTLMKKVCEDRGYSARVIHKLLRMARTAADLDGMENITINHVRKVLNCRDLDKSNGKMYVVGKM
ncbi:MAG: ATP-binding protein [Pseudobutyrivibrio ruminis]|uniref:YifB family Mg chelatase-like AAA ATPase n=1 Tax=Pseudobutyrivibrio ruminis TaxID=46206 RepID=UPI0026F31536|nr:YifB family Mg chelatase-like AAA ATPase [Pseudobutyrivibrio ruminis]MBE5912872.1 ATP-binding protein [Pseudobutyrivibrio ruminis]